MDQFSIWSGLVHSVLSKQSPKIKLGQIHQILAACLGHRTYASLRVADLHTVNQIPPYVLFDHEAGFARAVALGISLTKPQWREAFMALKPSGVTPFWLTEPKGMRLAADLAFRDAGDARIHAMKREVGSPDGHYALSAKCHSKDDELPEILRFDVLGEVCAITEDRSIAMPVTALVEFPKLGERIYGAGRLISIVRCGEPRDRDPEEFDYDGEIYGA